MFIAQCLVVNKAGCISYTSESFVMQSHTVFIIEAFEHPQNSMPEIRT